jgi:hypothetical protein
MRQQSFRQQDSIQGWVGEGHLVTLHNKKGSFLKNDPFTIVICSATPLHAFRGTFTNKRKIVQFFIGSDSLNKKQLENLFFRTCCNAAA